MRRKENRKREFESAGKRGREKAGPLPFS